ncbi:telomerase Cajal body protein 1 [Apis mellifera caucasica]|nr:telomerase Cajal body protein 1 [Apis mellifera caucasica]KAG9429710.1 telomerase Cajal body protein 1 [Apis mellifera carnica]
METTGEFVLKMTESLTVEESSNLQDININVSQDSEKDKIVSEEIKKNIQKISKVNENYNENLLDIMNENKVIKEKITEVQNNANLLDVLQENESVKEKILEIQNNENLLDIIQKNESIKEKISEIQNNVKSINIEHEDKGIKDKEMTHSNQFYCNWNNSPRLLCEATEEYQSTESYENFTKGCQWSPDGTCLLVPSEDFRIRIYELPREFYSEKFPLNLSSKKFSAALTVKEGGLIYDTCWYPFMNSWEPATCCFLSTSRESPIHLWDAFNSELRATYRAYNQVDEVEAALSIQFIDSAKEIWAGFKNTLRIFDVEQPGRQINTIQFKKDFPNVIGLVSCIRENPIMPRLVAFGTYSKYIGLYKDGPLCTFKTGNGVTQIEFSPCGTKLFSVVRRNNEFLCWDLRNPGTVLYSLEGRQSDTNQRIQFDIKSNGKEIVSGSTNGDLIVWELSNCENLNAKYKIKLSCDCINGINLHKNLPLVATSTGQRIYDSTIQSRDNSVRLWSFF